MRKYNYIYVTYVAERRQMMKTEKIKFLIDIQCTEVIAKQTLKKSAKQELENIEMEFNSLTLKNKMLEESINLRDKEITTLKNVLINLCLNKAKELNLMDHTLLSVTQNDNDKTF